jgi:hypothetical protein
MQEQGHDTSRLAEGEPGDGPEAEPGRSDLAGGRRTGLGSVILRGATVLLELLTWWPEAASAGHACVTVLQGRQGADRE